MDKSKIIKILEKLKRVRTDFSNENLNKEKLDIDKEFITFEDGRVKFLTTNLDLEEVVFHNIVLPEETFENLEYLLTQEKDIAESMYLYAKQVNAKLSNTKSVLTKMLDKNKTYNHSDSDLLINLLYEKTEDIKLYFYEPEDLNNVVFRKDFFEVLNKDLSFSDNFEIITDTNEGYMKISFPVNTFVNMIEFDPLYRANDKYSIFVNKDNTIDKLVIKDEELSIKGLATLNESCYHLVIKGDDIYNLASGGIKIKVGSSEGANSVKRGYCMLKAKLDFPNGNFKIVNSENKNIDMYVVPNEFVIDPAWLFGDLEDHVMIKGYKKIIMNSVYDDSLIDNKILMMFESSASTYRGIKILKV